MSTLLIIFSVLLGLIVGSFLNVVVLRLAKKESLKGRSHCPTCHHTLRWYELIPVISFIVQKRRCRQCDTVISWQYPLIELSTGLVFLSIFLVFGLSWYTLVLFVVFALLIAIVAYDIKHKIIPDVLVWLFVIISFVTLFISFVPQFTFQFFSLWDFLAGLLIPLPFALIWLFSKGRLMGLGDAKLMVGMGWLLGLTAGISAVLYAFWIGAIVGIALIVIKRYGLFGVSKGSTTKMEVPFAPFLMLGTFVALVLQFDIVALLF